MSVWLTWELAPDIECCDSDHIKTSNFRSTPFINYPIPIITPNTLHLNDSNAPVPNQTLSAVNMPRSGESYWMTFNGRNFGSYFHLGLITVTYASNGTNSSEFPCLTEPLNALETGGIITDTKVVCRTATQEEQGVYYFAVEVAGQRSSFGIDQMIFPAVPVVNSVSGCTGQNGDHTFDCMTSGGEIITISGSNLVSGTVRLYIFLTTCFFYPVYVLNL